MSDSHHSRPENFSAGQKILAAFLSATQKLKILSSNPVIALLAFYSDESFSGWSWIRDFGFKNDILKVAASISPAQICIFWEYIGFNSGLSVWFPDFGPLNGITKFYVFILQKHEYLPHSSDLQSLYVWICWNWKYGWYQKGNFYFLYWARRDPVYCYRSVNNCDSKHCGLLKPSQAV